MDAALMFFGLLWALLGGGERRSSSRAWPETQPPSPTPPALPAGGSAPPWPQVVPAGLPTFPGSGWQYDEPPPPAVQQRAAQLVSTLWARGAGTWKVEQTGGRWIAYQAQVVASGRKGVVAYRVRSAPALATRPAAAPAASVRPAAQPAPAAPVTRPQATPRPPAVTVTPTSSPAPSSPAPSSPVRPASVVALPVLRYGDGLLPQPPNPNVVLLQQRLGITADGRFGSGTRTAVIEFQRKTGLAPNQTNAQLQARGFGVVKEATWAKLFATQQG